MVFTDMVILPAHWADVFLMVDFVLFAVDVYVCGVAHFISPMRRLSPLLARLLPPQYQDALYDGCDQRAQN
jgi:hypothetical protein